jgi:hypothetical protein
MDIKVRQVELIMRTANLTKRLLCQMEVVYHFPDHLYDSEKLRPKDGAVIGFIRGSVIAHDGAYLILLHDGDDYKLLEARSRAGAERFGAKQIYV